MSAQRPSALRLTFSFDGDDVDLTGVRRIEMLPPPSDPLQGYQGRAGFWLEVRDPRDAAIYRRILHNPTSAYREVHAHPGSVSTHVTARDRTGAFDVVVPPAPPGSSVALFASPPGKVAPVGDVAAERKRKGGPRVGIKPAGEFARFALSGERP